MNLSLQLRLFQEESNVVKYTAIETACVERDIARDDVSHAEVLFAEDIGRSAVESDQDDLIPGASVWGVLGPSDDDVLRLPWVTIGAADAAAEVVDDLDCSLNFHNEI